MDVFIKLLEDPQVVTYFAVLGISIAYCFRYSQKTWQIACSLGAMSVTWFYIVRWMIEYKLDGGNNLFDDAYIDVLQVPHGAMSVQLLTWVAVATVWMQEANICYMLFGMLGAMSSAFVTWVPNKPVISRSIPWFFLPASVASLYAIEQLTITLDSPAEFGFWLKSLHILLVTPQIAVLVLPEVLQTTLDGCWIYGFLGVLIAYRHTNKGFVAVLDSYAVPVSDCQLSITYDLILCSLITLYSIHIQAPRGSSMARVATAAVAMVVLSPGAVLALWLCFHLGAGVHTQGVTALQAALAGYMQRQESTADGTGTLPWANLGLGWGVSGRGYTEACAHMATTLGEAVLAPGDGVLACGCGFGAELVLWKEKFQLRHITGIDQNATAAINFPLIRDVRLLTVPVEDIRPKFENKVRFTKVVALDSVYHYTDKPQFFADAAVLLPPEGGGQIAVTDLVLRSSAPLPIWLCVVLKSMNVNVNHLFSACEYEDRLRRSGWVNVSVSSMSDSRVLENWFPKSFLTYLEYCLVVAERPAVENPPRRANVAVIGSGLAGLTTARLLAGSHNVTVLEANMRGGLSGFGEDLNGQIVDIPLRIIGTGYYTFVEELAQSVDIPVAPIRGDYLSQLNYGDSNPHGTGAAFVYSHSSWANFWSCVPYVGDMLRFHQAVYEDTRPSGDTVSGSGSGSGGIKGESWGSWMLRHGYDCERYTSDSSGAYTGSTSDSSGAYTGSTHGYDCERYTSDSSGAYTGSTSASITPSADGNAAVDSFLMWMLMGQVSWMLSCNYGQILRYPSAIILGFIRSLGWGRCVLDSLYSSSSKTGRMMRVQPSMQALEYALTYGVEVRCNKRVGNVGGDRLIDGVTYDYIVIATEASSVGRILTPKLYSPVFSGVKYHPSSIYLHTDSSLMPIDRSQWNTFNMRQDKGQDMCMLTAWLNHYYPNAAFPDDVFQTWNPFTLPHPDKIIKRCDFLRVVHTADTADILMEIDKCQGDHGIYYAGAYSVEGMGLLEQAARSGCKVAELIKNDVAAKIL